MYDDARMPDPPDWMQDGSDMESAAPTVAPTGIDHPPIIFPFVNPKGSKGAGKPSQVHIENTIALLAAYKIRVRWNLMAHGLEIEIPGFVVETERQENTNLAKVIELAERRGLAQKQTIDHLLILASSYHPVAEWMLSRPWDGTDRIEQLISTVRVALHVDATLGYTLIKRWLISCARAVMPVIMHGRKFTPQGVLTIQGPQGIGKTEWIKSLAPPDKSWIAGGRVIDPHDRDSVQQATSFWIVEMGELDATYKKSDIAAIKAFVTQDTDTYRSAYARREEKTPRRTVLAASVNPKHFLVDETGNRRWWTIACTELNWKHGIDIQQLWAQVYQLAALESAQWWLSPFEMAALNTANASHELANPLIEDLWSTWFVATVQSTDVKITIAEIWAALPGRQNRARTSSEANTLAKALRENGCENETLLHGCKTYRVQRIAPPDEGHVSNKYRNFHQN